MATGLDSQPFRPPRRTLRTSLERSLISWKRLMWRPPIWLGLPFPRVLVPLPVSESGLARLWELRPRWEFPLSAWKRFQARAAAMGRRNELLCPVLNAGNGLIFFALFQWEEAGPVRITEDSALEPEKFCQRIERPTLVWGGGAEHYHDILDAEAGRGLCLIPRGQWPSAATEVAIAAESRIRTGAGDPPAGFQPRYVREAEARVQWRRRYAGKHSEGL